MGVRRLAVVVLAALLGGAVLLYSTGRLVPEQQAIPLPCPDIVAGCELPTARLHVVFDRQPRVMQPFRVTVRMPDAREVHASFDMRDMQMGLNRYRLKTDERGLWWGEVTLPVCMQGRSDWVLQLEVDGGRKYRVDFSAR